jgi:DNA mismatch endonuclease (patch repair protein)
LIAGVEVTLGAGWKQWPTGRNEPREWIDSDDMESPPLNTTLSWKEGDGKTLTDTVSPEIGHKMMAHVKSKDTTPEKIVRSWLHAHAYRFRLHGKDLPGSPDIVLPKYKTVIFVHGCFWHRHEECERVSMPATNVEFWKEKFRRNVERDKTNIRELEKLGWKMIVLWECEIVDEARLEKKVTESLKRE